MKRWLGGLMAFCMLFTLAFPQTLAADSPSVTVGSAEVELGKDTSVSFPISVQNLVNVAGLTVQVSYPEDVLAVTGVADDGVFKTEEDNSGDKTSPVQIMWNVGSAAAVSYSGQLASVSFDLLDSAKAGTYDITVKVTDAAEDGGKDITDDVKPINGTLTVKEASTPSGGDPTDAKSPSVTIGSAEVELGKDTSVSFPVSAQNLVNVAGLTVQVSYPEDVLAVTGVTDNGIFKTEEDNSGDKTSPVQIMWNVGSAAAVSYNGQLASVSFDLLNSAKAGTYNITVKVTDAAEDGGKDITDDVKTTNGTLTVKEGTTTVTEYDIEYKMSSGGTISGVAKAKADDSVTVTVTPDTGYELDKLTMNGEALSNPSFTMPAANAVVEATFKQVPPTGMEYSIEYKTSGNGTVSGVATAKAGDSVTVTVTPDSGYELYQLKVNGTQSGNPFVMPEANVVVEASFTLSNPDVTANEYGIEYKMSNGGTISGVAKAQSGTKVTVTVTPNSGYVLDKLTVNGKEVSNPFTMPSENAVVEATFTLTNKDNNDDGGGCYIATSVYGSYDAPEVWTLRRFRDDVLGQTWYGRLFIKAYYATSPTFIRLFGNTEWFQNFFREHLDNLVSDLQADGFESTPYADKDWQ